MSALIVLLLSSKGCVCCGCVGWAKRGYTRYLMEKQDGTVSQAPLNHCWMASANPPTVGFAPDGRLILETTDRSNDCACIQFVGQTGPKSVLNLCNWGCECAVTSAVPPLCSLRCSQLDHGDALRPQMTAISP